MTIVAPLVHSYLQSETKGQNQEVRSPGKPDSCHKERCSSMMTPDEMGSSPQAVTSEKCLWLPPNKRLKGRVHKNVQVLTPQRTKRLADFENISPF